VEAALAASPQPAEILVGAVEKRPHPRATRELVTMVETAATLLVMPDYGLFEARRTRRVPPRYLVLPLSDGLHEDIVRRLQLHGIRSDRVASPVSVAVERFMIRTVDRVERPVQGHREVAITGDFESLTVDAPAGAVVVTTDQPLGRLAFALLEPESDDGLTTWNALDAHLAPGRAHPVLKVLR
jgi:hypothetical protein